MITGYHNLLWMIPYANHGAEIFTNIETPFLWPSFVGKYTIRGAYANSTLLPGNSVVGEFFFAASKIRSTPGNFSCCRLWV